MDSSKNYRRMIISEHLFLPEKSNDQDTPSVLVKLTGNTAPPPSLEDVATLHRCFQPLWITMRLLGAFPITFTDKGIAIFKVKSRAFAYMSFVLLMTVILCVLVVIHRINVLRTADVNTLIVTYKCLLYCVAFLFYPIGHFIMPTRVTRYINELSQFLTRVHQITGTPLPIKFRRNMFVLTIFLPILILFLVTYEYFSFKHFLAYEAVFFGYTLTLINFHVVIWSSICVILIKSSRQLGDMLTEDLRAHAWDTNVVPKFRALWEELSYMTRQTGDVMSYAYGWLLISLFTVLTCATYGFLSDGFNNFGLRELGLVFNAVLVYIVLFCITTSAHYANNEVDGNFMRKLKELKSPTKDVQQQLEFFQIAIRLDAPCISLGGYVVINRGLLITVLAAIVTYLVVLLQFKIGAEPVQGKATNTTLI